MMGVNRDIGKDADIPFCVEKIINNEGGFTKHDLYSDRCIWQDIMHHNLPWN